MEQFDLTLFDLSPMAMWLQDFSEVKKIFQRWAAEGVVDFEKFLMEDTQRLFECLASIRTLRVNASTLKLYEANDLDEILANFIKFLTPDVTAFQVKFFCALWNNNTEYTIPVINYTCLGKQIDVQLRANVVTGYEETWALLLLTTEHISDYQNARRFAEALFMHSPTPLWVKDYSGIKKRFDLLHQEGISNLEAYIQDHPHFVQQCYMSTRSIQVNQMLLNTFDAKDQLDFEHNAYQQFSKLYYHQFLTQLLQLWKGETQFEHEYEVTNFEGRELFILEKVNIFPDSQHSWDTVQLAYIDLTERKKLEDHLHFVSHYDQLTQLHNRHFFNQELQRLQQQNIRPISCIYMDLNGLKEVNDKQGHHFGDLLLQRFAEILLRICQYYPCSVSRIGGDEFVVLLPNSTKSCAQALLARIEMMMFQEAAGSIRFAAGIACIYNEHHVENLVKMADDAMYQNKKNYYDKLSNGRSPPIS